MQYLRKDIGNRLNIAGRERASRINRHAEPSAY